MNLENENFRDQELFEVSGLTILRLLWQVRKNVGNLINQSFPKWTTIQKWDIYQPSTYQPSIYQPFINTVFISMDKDTQ